MQLTEEEKRLNFVALASRVDEIPTVPELDAMIAALSGMEQTENTRTTQDSLLDIRSAIVRDDG